MYAVVEFSRGKECAVVPLIWIQGDKCYWPVATNIPQAVNVCMPPKTSWPIYSIKKIYCTCELLNEAEAKLDDVISAATESEISSEDKTVLIKKNLNNQEEATKANEIIDEEDEEVFEYNSYNDENLQESSRDSMSRQRFSSCTPSSIPSSTTTLRSSGVEPKLITMIETLSEQVAQNSLRTQQILRLLSQSDKVTLEKPENFPILPVNKRKDFKELESVIREDTDAFNYLVRRLSTLGGSTVRQVTSSILKAIITNKLARKINWAGNNNKLAFKDTKCIEAVQGAGVISPGSIYPTQPLKHRHRIYDDQGTQGATVPPSRSTRFSPPLPGTAVGDPASTDAAEARPIGAVTADRRDGQHEQGETPTNSCPSGRAAASSLAADPMRAIATTHRARHRRNEIDDISTNLESIIDVPEIDTDKLSTASSASTIIETQVILDKKSDDIAEIEEYQNREVGDNPEKRVTGDRLYELAIEISQVFKKESVSTYYIPYINYGPKLRHAAKGKLLDCLNNRRREYRKAGVIKSLRRLSSGPSSSRIPEKILKLNEDLDSTVQEDLAWLRNSSDPWDIVELKWTLTAKVTLQKVFSDEIFLVSDYMFEFPALK
ncbi:hypothetical protein FQR65_LT16188 [Abscondita terminalis]|nr:hypothetical protein FQR65_LT16188 [Abscondita terminalis]